MTIGIYSLYWEEPDLIYIGQSVDVERRLDTHLRDLKNSSHCNYKVQEAYILYGIPTTCILEKCSSKELLSKEAAWANEFSNLLNIMEPGTTTGYGTQNPNSKLSTRQVLKIFSLLRKTKLTPEAIGKQLKVPRGTVEHIRYGTTHGWLLEKYRDKFIAMQEYRSRVCFDAKNKRENTLKVISPDGFIFEVFNLSRFARENNPFNIKWESFNRKLVQCMSNPNYNYFGWKVLKE